MARLMRWLTWPWVVLLSVLAIVFGALAWRGIIAASVANQFVLGLVGLIALLKAAHQAGVNTTSEKDKILMRETYERAKTGRPPPPEVAAIVDDTGQDVLLRDPSIPPAPPMPSAPEAPATPKETPSAKLRPPRP